MKLTITVLLLLSGMTAFAGVISNDAITTSAATNTVESDLTLGNLFSEGWDQSWTKRDHGDGAPDMALLRVQTNFLEREARFDYYYENNVNSASRKDINFGDALVAWGLNRRIMVEAVGIYEWVEGRPGHENTNGATGAFVGRLQLVDTQNSSYAFNFRVQPPDHDIGDKTTTMSYALAGWNDLTPLGLPKMGLYYHIMEENYVGPVTKGAKSNDITYDVSLAQTWACMESLGFRHFTTFLEAYAVTDLDGNTSGRTVVGLTPGIRFTLAKHHVFMFGADIQLNAPKPYDDLFRATYIYNF